MLPAVIQRKVWENVAKHKEEEEWLDYSRYHIVGLIGKILRDHYRVESYLFPAPRARELAADAEVWLPLIYITAVNAIRNARSEAIEKEEYGGPSGVFSFHI